ncbi:MAG: GNAT family N-acetyltransferase [Nitrososphaerales archaeon]
MTHAGQPPPPSPHLTRRCGDSDLDAVLEIEEESFSDPYDREVFSKLLRSEPGGFIVAEGEGGVVVGYVASSSRYGMIISLAVATGHRRAGVGRTLMEAALSYLRGRTETVSLQVRVGNADAIRLYRNLSFVERGRVKRYYPDGEDALVMTLTLRPPAERR